jgi:hypothetical protein
MVFQLLYEIARNGVDCFANGSSQRRQRKSHFCLGFLVGLRGYPDHERLDIGRIAEAYIFRSRVKKGRCKETQYRRARKVPGDERLSLALHIHNHSGIIF